MNLTADRALRLLPASSKRRVNFQRYKGIYITEDTRVIRKETSGELLTKQPMRKINVLYTKKIRTNLRYFLT
jgi:hypothetical protein